MPVDVAFGPSLSHQMFPSYWSAWNELHRFTSHTSQNVPSINLNTSHEEIAKNKTKYTLDFPIFSGKPPFRLFNNISVVFPSLPIWRSFTDWCRHSWSVVTDNDTDDDDDADYLARMRHKHTDGLPFFFIISIRWVPYGACHHSASIGCVCVCECLRMFYHFFFKRQSSVAVRVYDKQCDFISDRMPRVQILRASFKANVFSNEIQTLYRWLFIQLKYELGSGEMGDIYFCCFFFHVLGCEEKIWNNKNGNEDDLYHVDDYWILVIGSHGEQTWNT